MWPLVFLRPIGALTVAAGFLVLPDVYRCQVKPFRLAKLIVSERARSEWDTGIPPPEIASILSQPYRYLGQGKQSYAFTSADGYYVLKLFHFDRPNMDFGGRILQFFRSLLKKRPLRTHWPEVTFASCKLAFEELREETGIIWAHLNPRAGAFSPIEIADYIGRTHWIDPAKYRFVLQRKGASIFPALLHAAANNDRAAFDRMVSSFFSLLRTLEERKISVFDAKMPSNFGFIGEKAILIDIGSNEHSESPSMQQFETKLIKWLGKKGL